jgi:hypothetical protein
MDWVLTKGLQNLRAQVNAAFPNRDHASDGAIGDLAHMAGTSGHNPDDTPGSSAEYNDHDGIREVRAWDMDSDLRTPGVTAQQVVDHLRALPGISARLRYLIYNRKIYEASNGWKPRAYTGPSPHTEHIHFSGARSQAADNDTTFDYRLEDLVAITDDDIRRIWAYVPPKGNPYTPGADTTTMETYLRYAPSLAGISNGVDAKLKGRFDALQQGIALDDVDEQAIVTGVLAGLTPELLGQAFTAAGWSPEQVIAAIPDDMAEQVLEGMGARLSAEPRQP